MPLNVKTPWYSHSEGVPLHLSYPDCSMVDLVKQAAKATPDIIAYNFFGVKVTFSHLMQEIKQCVRSTSCRRHRTGGQGDHLHAEYTPGSRDVLCNQLYWCNCQYGTPSVCPGGDCILSQ